MKASFLIIAAGLALAAPAAAQAPRETITPVFAHVIPNVPGKSLVAVVVAYPPGGATPAHHHAKSAFIFGYVLSGTIQSQVEGAPLTTLKAGESFYEAPGAHHLISRNASTNEPAKLLAVLIVDSNSKQLTILDK